jgi:hypothetical protein
MTTLNLLWGKICKLNLGHETNSSRMKLRRNIGVWHIPISQVQGQKSKNMGTKFMKKDTLA